MSDIFISYASEDRQRVAPLAMALSEQGWSVWWDRAINAGRSFDEVIEAELTAARIVLVAWSHDSVQSRWVRAEAQEGLDHNKLIPIFLDAVTPPLIFRSIQTVSLLDWDGQDTDQAFTRLVADIGRLLEHPADPETMQLRDSIARPHQTEHIPSPQHRGDSLARTRSGSMKWAGAAIGALLAIGIAGYLYLQPGQNILPDVTPPPAADAPLARPALSIFRDTLQDGFKGPEMVVIPAGEFRMGDLQGNGRSNERPAHRVHIARGFAIGKYELGYEEYLQFATSTGRPPPYDEGWGRGRRPVIDVSWEDAQAYTRWLSDQTGEPYRLPTESEWEYASRAGMDMSYWWGNDVQQDDQVQANCDGCGSQWDGSQTAPAGSFTPNPNGLYDTTGNVAEWVEDCYLDNYRGAFEDGSPQVQEDCEQRVIRNGGWNSTPEKIRSPARAWDKPLNRSSGTGFRIARDLDTPTSTDK